MDLGKMTDEQLIELLREGKTEITDYLMEKYNARNWAAFAQENHFCEDGHASARCADWILARLGRKEKTP